MGIGVYLHLAETHESPLGILGHPRLDRRSLFNHFID
jgi:hypothetical protein